MAHRSKSVVGEAKEREIESIKKRQDDGDCSAFRKEFRQRNDPNQPHLPNPHQLFESTTANAHVALINELPIPLKRMDNDDEASSPNTHFL